MDPIKIIIFVAAFLLLLLLGRKLSGTEKVHAAPPPPELPQPMPVTAIVDTEDVESPKKPAAVGSDLPFTIQLPELVLRDDGTYNRPEFMNYYFGEIDLITGPPNPASFCDEFFMETRDPKDERVGTYKYLVATPAGLQAEMDSERLSALNLGDQSIIVSRWDLPLILDTVVKDIIKTYGGWATYSGEHAVPNQESDTEN
jgi:hypothetical protein